MVSFVRDGKKVWPTCPECGCRLRETLNGILTHYKAPMENGKYLMKDARGCVCSLTYMGAYIIKNEILFWSTGPHH